MQRSTCGIDFGWHSPGGWRGGKTESHACALHSANAAGSSNDLFPFITILFLKVISRKKGLFNIHGQNSVFFFFLSLLQHTVILFKRKARNAACLLIAMLCSSPARQLELISAFLGFCKKEKKIILLSLILLRSPSSTASRTSPECRATPGSMPWPSSSAMTRPRRSPATQVPHMLSTTNSTKTSIHTFNHPFSVST